LWTVFCSRMRPSCLVSASLCRQVDMCRSILYTLALMCVHAHARRSRTSWKSARKTCIWPSSSKTTDPMQLQRRYIRVSISVLVHLSVYRRTCVYMHFRLHVVISFHLVSPSVLWVSCLQLWNQALRRRKTSGLSFMFYDKVYAHKDVINQVRTGCCPCGKTEPSGQFM
jgi:hypothetical protein